MPKVKTKSGKIKHFEYTMTGKNAAMRAAMEEGAEMMKKKKKKKGKQYGIGNLKD